MRAVVRHGVRPLRRPSCSSSEGQSHEIVHANNSVHIWPRIKPMRRTKYAVQWLFACLVLIGSHAWAQDSVTYVYTDPQGTPLAEADASGHITATFDYTPYGTTALGAPSSEPGYTGHVIDSETNLVYMQARYFDPAVGRFLSTDPVTPEEGNPVNFNRYDYANNNPVINFDPTGRACGASGEVGSNVQKMRDLADHCGETARNSSSQSRANTSVGHVVVQSLIGFLKGASNELCNFPIVSCDEGPGQPQATPSNQYQEGGMYAGVFAIRAGESAITEGESAEVNAEREAIAIKGFTKHGIDRAVGDGAKRAGTRPEAILDALKNPTKIKSGIDNQGRPFSIYTGRNARVVINPETRQIISVNPLSGAGAH